MSRMRKSLALCGLVTLIWPAFSHASNTQGVKNMKTQPNVTAIAAPEVVSIPIKDSHEPLVDLKAQETIVLGPSPEIPNNQDYTKMRASVYRRLVQAQEKLPKGIRLCLYEGYRSIALQDMLFNNRYNKLKTQFPSWNQKQLFDETIKLVSPVKLLDGTVNIPPHSTGAAIDVYLVDEQGQTIEMGIHPKDWMQDTDGTISITLSSRISKDAALRVRARRFFATHAFTKPYFIPQEVSTASRSSKQCAAP